MLAFVNVLLFPAVCFLTNRLTHYVRPSNAIIIMVIINSYTMVQTTSENRTQHNNNISNVFWAQYIWQFHGHDVDHEMDGSLLNHQFSTKFCETVHFHHLVTFFLNFHLTIKSATKFWVFFTYNRKKSAG